MLISTAKLRMPKNTPKDVIEKRVKEVLEMVELTPFQNSLIRKLSGGQKKRASIAVELLSDPKLFFLDEPTSGLDPGTEKSLMDTLNRLAKKEHKTIITVTHNINNLEICDQIIFMAPGGRLAFMGSCAEAKLYFQVRNLHEIYDLLQEDPARWQKRWQNHQARTKTPVSRQEQSLPLQPQKDTFLHQLLILMGRYTQLITKDPFKLGLLILQPIIIALLLGVVSSSDIFHLYEDTKSMMFSLSCAAIWLGLFDTIQEICKERVIVKREYMNKLKIPAYLAAKMTVFAIIGLIQAILLVTTYLWAIGKSPQGLGFFSSTIETICWIFLTVLAAQTLGFTVSSLSKTGDKAMSYAPFILIIQLLFSGILFKLSGIGSWISRLTISKWSVEGLGAIANLNELTTKMEQEYPNIPMEREIEEAFSTAGDHTFTLLAAMLLLCVVCTLLCGQFLRQIKKDTR